MPTVLETVMLEKYYSVHLVQTAANYCSRWW